MTDRITPKQRSYVMSRVKSKNTGIELLVRSALHKKGLRFRKHVKKLPGNPDIVFTTKKIAIFVDGDFWHGYRYRQRCKKFSLFWKKKIEGNMMRDKKNFRKLRKNGWTVVRIWEHQIESDFVNVMKKLYAIVMKSR